MLLRLLTCIRRIRVSDRQKGDRSIEKPWGNQIERFPGISLLEYPMERRLKMQKTCEFDHLFATGMSKPKIAKTLRINRESANCDCRA